MILATLLACARAPEPGNPEFNDAIHQAFVGFDDPEVELAFALRELERNIDANIDPTAKSSNDRALAPDPLTADDIANLEHPSRDPEACIPVALVGLSAFPPEDAAAIQMLEDQTAVEPYSPNYFERSFLTGGDCWEDRGCDRMNTFNDLVKENFLMEVETAFLKDFRWVDMNLPDPADVPVGEEPTNPGEPRWAFVGRSWQTDSFDGKDGKSTLWQSYTIETWIPRDGGTLRLLALWSETDLGISISDDVVAGTTRAGIDDNYKAQEKWLEEHFGR
ncbi:MAG: hypothetical protein KC621_27005 [Myxococcales bacterium]|nr:hypothetical protein [Myxococcales bacterium]